MRTPSFCKINLRAAIQIAVLVGFSALFLYMLKTGEITNYLHPRMIPFVLFAAVAFLLMTIPLFKTLKKRERRVSVMPVFIFALPLVLACAVPGKAVTGSSLTFSNAKIMGIPASRQAPLSGAGQNFRKAAASPAPGSAKAAVKLGPNQTAVTATSPYGTQITLIITNNTIVSWVNELNTHPARYAGKKIEYTGSVFKSGSGFKSDEFVPGRDMMWCCAADIQLIGILCRYDWTSELKENCWVKVTGTLAVSTYQGAKVPLIVRPSVIPAPKPEAAYVYPAY